MGPTGKSALYTTYGARPPPAFFHCYHLPNQITSREKKEEEEREGNCCFQGLLLLSLSHSRIPDYLGMLCIALDYRPRVLGEGKRDGLERKRCPETF